MKQYIFSFSLAGLFFGTSIFCSIGDGDECLVTPFSKNDVAKYLLIKELGKKIGAQNIIIHKINSTLMGLQPSIRVKRIAFLERTNFKVFAEIKKDNGILHKFAFFESLGRLGFPCLQMFGLNSLSDGLGNAPREASNMPEIVVQIPDFLSIIDRHGDNRISSSPCPIVPAVYTDGRMWGGSANHYNSYRDGASAKKSLRKRMGLGDILKTYPIPQQLPPIVACDIVFDGEGRPSTHWSPLLQAKSLSVENKFEKTPKKEQMESESSSDLDLESSDMFDID